MAGPSDGWLSLGGAWVCCSPHVSIHYCYCYYHHYQQYYYHYLYYTRVSYIKSLTCLFKISPALSTL